MKISQDLSQFKNQKTLLIVSGTRESKFFLAHDGDIDEIDHFKLEEKSYSDKEGFMQKGMFGRTIGAGFVLEKNKKKLEDDFIKILQKHLNEISGKNDIASVYLFTPSHIKNHIKKAIPSPLDKKVESTITGNYHNLHPFKLIEKIDESKK